MLTATKADNICYSYIKIKEVNSMKIIKKVDRKKMVQAMQREATKKFAACNPEKCPRCRISDG